MYIHANRLSDFYIFQKQKIIAVNFDFGPHIAVCQQQIFGIFADERRLSVANLPNFCY